MARHEPRRATIGVLFWIALILLVLVIFLANRSNIEQVMESTGIVEVIRNRLRPAPGQPEAQPAPPTAVPVTTPSPDPEPAPRVVFDEPRASPEPPSAPAPSSPATTPPTTVKPTPQPTGTPAPVAPDPARTPSPTTAQRAPSPDPDRPNRLMASLYFVKVTDEGRTYPQRVVRPVYYSTSPLTESIRALLAGPTGEELTSGLLNLLPNGTRLISAHVTDGVAFLNFSAEFRFNPLGAEGTVAQIMQIIYSSTEFPTVDSVQFLVEGEQLDYLGGDGIYVGRPLGRDAFRL